MFKEIKNATLRDYFKAALKERHTGVEGFKAATALRIAKSRLEYNSPRGIALTYWEREQHIDHGDFIRLNGKTYAVLVLSDDDSTPPWDRSDGHGPVSEWTTRDKRPGELVLNSDRHSKRYYDFQEAMQIAKRDRWNAKPYRENESKGEKAFKAVMADFNFLKDWCNDVWRYVGVVVVELPKNGLEDQSDLESDWHQYKNAALWGIESCADEYIGEVAFELATELAEGREIAP